jgi:hypothetical protein
MGEVRNGTEGKPMGSSNGRRRDTIPCVQRLIGFQYLKIGRSYFLINNSSFYDYILYWSMISILPLALSQSHPFHLTRTFHAFFSILNNCYQPTCDWQLRESLLQEDVAECAS